MKKILVCSLLLSSLFVICRALPVFAANPEVAESSQSAQVCIERPKNEGLLDTVPIKVLFSNNQKLYLLGGQSACIIVGPGDYTFKVKSDDPYPSSHKGKPKNWESKTVKLHVNGGKTANFTVSPAIHKKGYAGGWNVRAASK